ncbi:MAG: acylphosphatase [Lachnospiraceae bacterium]|nr:acylphosphatase [Lachnospiraceae bacterium]
MNIIRRHYIFYGWVQGVGFRYRAYHAAHRYGVAGWVRNLPDYTVEMELEGSERDIDEVILCVERSDYIRIDNMDVKDIPIHNEHTFNYR